MTEPFYVAVKASLHASDSSVFGLTPEEVNALSKRYPDSNREVINGVLIKGEVYTVLNTIDIILELEALCWTVQCRQFTHNVNSSPLKVINSLCELGYRVVCSSGEAEIVWTLRREVLDESTSEFECRVITAEPLGNIQIPAKDNVYVQRNAGNIETEGTLDSEATKNVVQVKQKEVERIGTRPEDFAAFSDYSGPKIVVRNPSSLENIEEGTPVIVNTNTANPQNPLAGSYTYFSQVIDENRMKKMEPCFQCNHSCVPPTASAHQTLDEMDFERGIWTAAMTGDIDKIRSHLNKGISPDAEDKAGYTALHYSARCGYPHACAVLLEAGASVNKATRAGGATALHRAALVGQHDVCRLLMRYGANPFAKDVDGRTPLHRAVEGGHKNVIAELIDAVPSAAFEKDNQGKTPLDYAEEKPSLFSLFKNTASKT